MSAASRFPTVHVIDHPVVQDKLSRLRDVSCSKRNFKAHLYDISLLMAYELTKDLETEAVKVQTPLEEMEGRKLKRPPVIIPILRAALGMTGALEDVLQEASIGHIGVYRDEKTHLPIEYLVKLPDLNDRDIYLVDPMLATGHSAVYAMKILEEKGADISRVKFMGLIAAPEGVETFLKSYPDTHLYFASLDRQLNEKAYICPGLGDAGDRLLGTQ